MARHGIPCPRVVQLRKHVLLMTFIGRNRVAAPKLKDAQLSVADLEIAYDQIVQVKSMAPLSVPVELIAPLSITGICVLIYAVTTVFNRKMCSCI